MLGIQDLDEWSFLSIYAQVLFPGDEKKHNDIFTAAKTYERFQEADPKPSSFRIAQHYLKTMPGRNAARRHGFRAGQVLLNIKTLFDHQKKIRERDPSLDVAFAITAKEQKCSPSAVRKAWASHRGVSHFWAGMIVTAVQQPDWLNTLRPPGVGPHSKEFAANTLSFAEGFLKWANAHQTGLGNLKKPILTLEESWQSHCGIFGVPVEFSISEWSKIDQTRISLSPRKLEAAMHYKADERHLGKKS